MTTKQRFRDMLEQIYIAHREFACAWESSKKEFGDTERAYRDSEEQSQTLYSLVRLFFEDHIIPLRQPFIAGESQAIDSVLDFLEVDVPAFKCGYAKEWHYRKLKALQLSKVQVKRIRQIALARCDNPEYRREDSELRRLMIHIADLDFLRNLGQLSDNPDPLVRKKAKVMMEVVLNGRKDLKQQKFTPQQRKK